MLSSTCLGCHATEKTREFTGKVPPTHGPWKILNFRKLKDLSQS